MPLSLSLSWIFFVPCTCILVAILSIRSNARICLHSSHFRIRHLRSALPLFYHETNQLPNKDHFRVQSRQASFVLFVRLVQLVRLVWGPYSVPLPFPGAALFGQWRSTRSYLGRRHTILLRFAFETHRPLSCKKKPDPSGEIRRGRPNPFMLPHRAEVHKWRVDLGFVPHRTYCYV